MSEPPSPGAAHTTQLPPQKFLPVSMGWHFALCPRYWCALHSRTGCPKWNALRWHILRRGFLIANQVLAERRLPNPLGAASCNARVAGSEWVGDRVSAKTRSDLGNSLMELARAKRNLSVLITTAICIINHTRRDTQPCCPLRMNHRNRG